jgi:hypothetical protein
VVVAGIKQDGGETIKRMAIDTALGSIDLPNIVLGNHFSWRPLSINLPLVYQE